MREDRRVTEPVPAPDADAAAATRTLVTADARLGRLGELCVWAAGAQGAAPPRAFARPVALVVAGRHDAARYVDRVDAGEVGRRVEALRSVGAGSGGREVPLRVLDVGESGESFVRASAGPIAREDALTAAETERGLAVGRAAADREVDAGADLLVVGAVDADTGPATAALMSVLSGREPVACVRRGGDPRVWARTVEVVRDARRRGLPHRDDPLALLTAIGGADLAALVGVLTGAAGRRTPVLLDGTAATVSGLLAESLAAGSARWWAAASRSGDPAHTLALDALGFAPILDLGLGLDGAAAGLLALPLLQAAAGALR